MLRLSDQSSNGVSSGTHLPPAFLYRSTVYLPVISAFAKRNNAHGAYVASVLACFVVFVALPTMFLSSLCLLLLLLGPCLTPMPPIFLFLSIFIVIWQFLVGPIVSIKVIFKLFLLIRWFFAFLSMTRWYLYSCLVSSSFRKL